MNNKNILITNIGRRGYLVKYIKEIETFSGKIYVSDCDITASGLYGSNDGYFILNKPVDNPQKYVESLLELCKKESIGIIIPVIDPELNILSRYKSVFEKNNIFVAVSSSEVLDICYDKSKMNDFLVNRGFNIPRTYYSLVSFENDYKRKTISFPVILKPINGSGSVLTSKISSLVELQIYWNNGMMIQEFINGQEYGVDVLNNLERKPIRCVVKKKILMRSGETDKALVIKNDKIQETIIRLADELGHICNLDCDLLVKNDVIYIIDLNPRFGGGYVATHMSKENYLNLILRMVAGDKIEEDFISYSDEILVMKDIDVVIKKVDNCE